MKELKRQGKEIKRQRKQVDFRKKDVYNKYGEIFLKYVRESLHILNYTLSLHDALPISKNRKSVV